MGLSGTAGLIDVLRRGCADLVTGASKGDLIAAAQRRHGCVLSEWETAFRCAVSNGHLIQGAKRGLWTIPESAR